MTNVLPKANSVTYYFQSTEVRLKYDKEYSVETAPPSSFPVPRYPRALA